MHSRPQIETFCITALSAANELLLHYSC